MQAEAYCIRKDLRSPYIVFRAPWKGTEKSLRKNIFRIYVKMVAKRVLLCIITPVLTKPCALVAELVDALDSGSSGGSLVKVRVLSGAPNKDLQVNCLQVLTCFLERGKRNLIF